jgi:ABC-2 type transport system ATP-binding protein
MTSPLIITESLGREFEGRWIFRRLSLEIRPGERVAVVGPNGSGKTTFLRVLVTLLAPSEGEVYVEGVPLSRQASRARRRIGWASATDGGFFPRLTGRENLLCFGSLQGHSRADVERSLGGVQHLPTLCAALKTPYALCSSGMRQILHIHRALLGSPKLLVLDEPTRSLDGETAREVREWLGNLPPDLALVYSTHSSIEASSLGTRSIVLRQEPA